MNKIEMLIYQQGVEDEKDHCIAIIEFMIKSIKERLKEEDGLNIEEWWSSEIFTGKDIDYLITAIKDKDIKFYKDYDENE